MARARTRRRGAHTVEFTLLMPVFVLLVTGCMEYAWVMVYRSALTSAVDVGCRAASLVDPGQHEADVSDVYAVAAERMADAFERTGPGCDGSCVTAVDLVGAPPARSVRCTLQVDYGSITGVLPTPATLRATAVVRLEYQRSSG